VKRIVLGLAAVYLLLAATTKVLERRGVMRCGCGEACWCKKPVLSAFRWVAPFGHRG
jgi:hypothetical protein